MCIQCFWNLCSGWLANFATIDYSSSSVVYHYMNDASHAFKVFICPGYLIGTISYKEWEIFCYKSVGDNSTNSCATITMKSVMMIQMAKFVNLYFYL